MHRNARRQRGGRDGLAGTNGKLWRSNGRERIQLLQGLKFRVRHCDTYDGVGWSSAEEQGNADGAMVSSTSNGSSKRKFISTIFLQEGAGGERAKLEQRN